MRSESRRGYKPTYSSLFVTTPQSASPTAPRKGAPFGAVQVRHNKPALKGEVDASVTSRRRGCIVAALVYVNPSVTAYAVPAPRKGAFWGGTMCQDIRVNAPVGTRSPYSLPFAILPVPARSPFRFIRHWRRSTPNLTRRKADFTWRSHISHCKSNISPVRKNGFHRA